MLNKLKVEDYCKVSGGAFLSVVLCFEVGLGAYAASEGILGDAIANGVGWGIASYGLGYAAIKAGEKYPDYQPLQRVIQANNIVKALLLPAAVFSGITAYHATILVHISKNLLPESPSNNE